MLSPKDFINSYFSALSGQAKTPEMVERFVSDEHLAQHIATTEAAFPRYELDVKDLIAEGNKVVARAVFRGTHTGPYNGIPASHKVAIADVIIIYEIAGDKITKFWMQMDTLAALQQLQS